MIVLLEHFNTISISGQLSTTFQQTSVTLQEFIALTSGFTIQ